MIILVGGLVTSCEEGRDTNSTLSHVQLDDEGVAFQTGSFSSRQTRLFIAQGGNVGIGTTNPGHKLDVHGTIRAEEVIVELFTPDYVFRDGFALKSLEEVEEFIEANDHLPGVPSETDIDNHGASLGDMQAVLLQKIEELTLYTIEQQKELARQKGTIAALNEKLDSLGSAGK